MCKLLAGIKGPRLGQARPIAAPSVSEGKTSPITTMKREDFFKINCNKRVLFLWKPAVKEHYFSSRVLGRLNTYCSLPKNGQFLQKRRQCSWITVFLETMTVNKETKVIFRDAHILSKKKKNSFHKAAFPERRWQFSKQHWWFSQKRWKFSEKHKHFS